MAPTVEVSTTRRTESAWSTLASTFRVPSRAGSSISVRPSLIVSGIRNGAATWKTTCAAVGRLVERAGLEQVGLGQRQPAGVALGHVRSGATLAGLAWLRTVVRT